MCYFNSIIQQTNLTYPEGNLTRRQWLISSFSSLVSPDSVSLNWSSVLRLLFLTFSSFSDTIFEMLQGTNKTLKFVHNREWWNLNSTLIIRCWRLQSIACLWKVQCATFTLRFSSSDVKSSSSLIEASTELNSHSYLQLLSVCQFNHWVQYLNL